MSSSLLSSSSAIIPSSLKHYNRRAFRVRAQRCRDGGRSSNGVDANLRVLKERIEQVKMKEKLEICCRSPCDHNDHHHGWYHHEHDYDHSYEKIKRDMEISEFFEILSLVGSTISFTCLAGTLFLCLVSVFVHLRIHDFS